MRPFEFIPTHPIASANHGHSSKPIDETISQFLSLSAYYMKHPAEHLAELKK